MATQYGGSGDLGKYPHLFPPPGFIQFDRNGLLTIPAVAGITTLETIQLTSGYEGWVRAIGLECGDWAIGNYAINIGNAPIRDYTRIEVPLGSPTTPKEVFIALQVNVPLTLTFNSTGAAPVPVRWSLWGWYYAI